MNIRLSFLYEILLLSTVASECKNRLNCLIVNFAGDLMYIDIVTLEDVHINITASTSGFFINR